MGMLLKYKIKEMLNAVVIYKILTFILLLTIYYPYNDVDTIGKSIENKYKVEKSLSIIFSRLLAKHELKMDFKHPDQEENLSYNTMKRNIKNELDNKSTLGHLKKGGLSDLNSYKAEYEQRYSKKKGIAKLECHCEKKIFDHIDKLYELKKKMKNKKGSLKKAIYKKYGIHIVFSAFFFLIALIIAIASQIKEKYNWNSLGSAKSVLETLIPVIGDILVYVIPPILASVIIYVSIKFFQYECLKAGIGKMNLKECFLSCKNIF
ncbi:Plasmodium exported protein, unknown function [Plasmodium vivax]|uniref:Variable surface protein Vir35 n=1 Tax=Plasmodium vivax TaxID=5855 RepID=A0A1G4E4L3_PLAVI|nr:Plasmodium exported protein, unknown function [Plasmodium vivax]